MPKCVYLASIGVKIEHTAGVQNKDFFFQNAYLTVISTETLATSKVKIAKIYASKLKHIHGKLNKIEFCYTFCRICLLGRLAAIIIHIVCVKDFSGTTAPRILKFGTNVG